MEQRKLLFVGVQGSVIAYDKSSGQKVWSTDLTGSSFVNLLRDGEQLFAHTKGELFALDARTGRVLWKDGLKGYGFGLASLVTESVPANSQAVLAEHDLEQQRQDGSVAAVSASTSH